MRFVSKWPTRCHPKSSTTKSAIPSAVWPDMDDDLLARIAVERGLLAAAAADDCIRDAAALSMTLAQFLTVRGLVAQTQVAELEAEARRRRFLGGGIPRGLLVEAASAAAQPKFSRFDLHEKLGEGGAAVVHRATDRM